MITNCSHDHVTEWVRESRDLMGGDVAVDVTIDAQPVAITFDDGLTFVDADWVGPPDMTRTWLAYITPELLPAAMTVEVLVRITDDTDPGQPIEAYFPAGTITFT